MTTSNREHAPSQHQLSEASLWVLAIDENPQEANAESFKQWLNSDIAHQRAFEEVAHTFLVAGSLPKNLLPLPEKQTHRRFLWKKISGVAAIAAAVVMCLFVTMPEKNPMEMNTANRLQTTIGDVSHVSLPDGSNLTLDTSTRVEWQFEGEKRAITLLQGRVFADVKPNPQSPFFVSLDEGFSFTALGTAYTVEKRERQWTLEVYEGTVGIQSAMLYHAPVEAGWGLTYQGGKLKKYRLKTPLKAGIPDWQHKHIVLDHTPLQTAIDSFNRYQQKTIRIGDNELAHLSLSGTFSLSNPEAFLKSVETLTGAQISQEGDHWTISLPRTTQND